MRVLHFAPLHKGVDCDDIQYHFCVHGDGIYVDESEVRIERIHGGAACAALLCVDDDRAGAMLAMEQGGLEKIGLPGARIRVHRNEGSAAWIKDKGTGGGRGPVSRGHSNAHKAEAERKPTSVFWQQYMARRGGRHWRPCDKWVRSVCSMRCSVDEIAMGMFSDGERIVRMAVE